MLQSKGYRALRSDKSEEVAATSCQSHAFQDEGFQQRSAAVSTPNFQQPVQLRDQSACGVLVALLACMQECAWPAQSR